MGDSDKEYSRHLNAKKGGDSVTSSLINERGIYSVWICLLGSTFFRLELLGGDMDLFGLSPFGLYSTLV